jgi:hypothetical protein
LAYPPIAKAARVSGVVIGRVIYSTSGSVERFETVSGPVMLRQSVIDQAMKWMLKTDAAGSAPCETLVIANFRLHDPSEPAQERRESNDPPQILRLTIDGAWMVLSDPEVEISTVYKNPFLRLRWKIKRDLHRIFRRRDPMEAP